MSTVTISEDPSKLGFGTGLPVGGTASTLDDDTVADIVDIADNIDAINALIASQNADELIGIPNIFLPRITTTVVPDNPTRDEFVAAIEAMNLKTANVYYTGTNDQTDEIEQVYAWDDTDRTLVISYIKDRDIQIIAEEI